MARHGSLAEFDSSQEDWKSYAERLGLYFQANNVEEGMKQRAILLSACGPATYQLIKNLLTPAKPGDKTFAENFNSGTTHEPSPAETLCNRPDIPLPLKNTQQW